MTADYIKKRISEMCTLFGFEYKGIDGNVDPYFSPECGNCFLLFYNGKEQIVHSIDQVMKSPFIDGKSLTELASIIRITEN